MSNDAAVSPHTPMVVRILGGCAVLAKLYKGDPVPVTYANLTQANTKADTLRRAGIACNVIGRRPFYIHFPGVAR